MPVDAAKDKGTTAGGKPKKVWTDDCPEPPNWGNEVPPPKPVAAKPPPPPAAPAESLARAAKPVRPKDVAEWTPADFRSAQRDNDPRLTDAVAYLGKHFVTKESVDLLAKLIEPPPVDASAQRPAQRVTASPALIEAVVGALAANGTVTARQILERLAAGTQKTAYPQIAAAAALKSLLRRSSQENEDLVFRVVSAPEQTATADRAAIDPNKLRSTALEWVKSSASESFRLRLANYLTGPEPPAAFNQIWTSLSDPRIENLAAQIILYQSDRLPESARLSLERQFAQQSQAALHRLLGFPRPKQTQPPSGDATMIVDAHRAAELLWGANFAAAVEERLRAAEGSNRSPLLLSLACTIPCHAIRSTMRQTMEEYWEEGPKRFEPCAASDQSLPEPGFLLLVKQVPRTNAHALSAGSAADRGAADRSAADRGAASRPSGSSRAAKMAAMRKVRDRQDHAAQQWVAFSETLAQAMCRQFWAAARARKSAMARSEPEEVPTACPIKLPPNLTAVASHRVDWPKDFGGALADLHLPPLRVHYIRIERRARPDKLVAYFRRQLPSAGEHSDEHGIWLDDFSFDRKTRNARSVDVFITKPNKDIGILLGQEQQVVVELLTVECLSQDDDQG